MGAPNGAAYLDAAASMAVHYAGYMQDRVSGLFYHGFDAVNNATSCCYWGRANGWVVMAQAEVLLALTSVAPKHPAFAPLLAAYQKHMAGLLAVQSSDGRWHQVRGASFRLRRRCALAHRHRLACVVHWGDR